MGATPERPGAEAVAAVAACEGLGRASTVATSVASSIGEGGVLAVVASSAAGVVRRRPEAQRRLVLVTSPAASLRVCPPLPLPLSFTRPLVLVLAEPVKKDSVPLFCACLAHSRPETLQNCIALHFHHGQPHSLASPRPYIHHWQSSTLACSSRRDLDLSPISRCVGGCFRRSLRQHSDARDL